MQVLDVNDVIEQEEVVVELHHYLKLPYLLELHHFQELQLVAAAIRVGLLIHFVMISITI